jgi:putative aldouronate transport system permease protein
LSKRDLPFSGTITAYFLITMFFSGGLIPTFFNMKNIGIYDTFWVYVFPAGFSMYNTIIVRNYFMSIDNALEEAAQIDGATHINILFQIILPLSKPVLATVGLWQLVGNWNSWYDNLMYVRNSDLLTLQLHLQRMLTSAESLANESAGFAMDMSIMGAFNSETIKAAITILVIVPIMCVYPFLQKYFVKGIMVGGVKG